jgi:hypothetical protein
LVGRRHPIGDASIYPKVLFHNTRRKTFCHKIRERINSVEEGHGLGYLISTRCHLFNFNKISLQPSLVWFFKIFFLKQFHCVAKVAIIHKMINHIWLHTYWLSTGTYHKNIEIWNFYSLKYGEFGSFFP